MRTLVIGASGYVGRRVGARLLAAGHEVVGLARSADAQRRLDELGFGVLPGDVADPDGIVRGLDRFDVVVFAPQVDHDTEVQAVDALVGALSGTGTRFIFTSGTGVVAIRTAGEWDDRVFAEDDPPPPRPAAYAGRIAAEQLVRAAGASGRLTTAVVRPPMVWGYGRCPPIAALHASVSTGAVCYVGSGLAVYGTVHVDDLADLYLAIIERGTSGALYHAVSGEVSWRCLAEEVGRLRGVPTRSIGMDEAKEVFGPFLATVVFGSCSRITARRARDELRWEPSPDRLDIYAEVAHPAFTSPDAGTSGGFTLAEALRTMSPKALA